jgi:hypothetical protein
LAAHGIVIAGGLGNPNLLPAARGIIIVGGLGNPNLLPGAANSFNPQPEPPGHDPFSSGAL